MPGKRPNDAICRTESISGHTVPFFELTFRDGVQAEVPQFVRRIAPGPWSRLAPGWQIAIRRASVGGITRYFPDPPHVTDRQTAAEHSLAEAVRALPGVLRQVPVPRRSGLRHHERKRALNATGLPGLRTVWLFDKRTGVFNLKIDVRIGGGERADASKRRRYHVGHERSVDESKLRAVGFKAWGWRREKLTVLPMVYQEMLAPRRGRTPGMQLDVDRVFDQLDQAKVRQHDILTAYAQARALKAVRGEMRLVVWREVPIRWHTIELDGQYVRLPECIERRGRMWVMAWPCPDGSHFRARRPVSADPEADLAALIHDGLLAAAQVTVRPARGLFDAV